VKRRTFLAFVVFILPASGLYAQQIAGNWQAELKTGSQEYRLFLQVAQGKDNGWRAMLLNIGKGREAIPVRLTAVQNDLKLQIDAIKAVYEGKVSDGGAAIDGT